MGLVHGNQAADIYMKADAKLTAVELLKAIKAGGKTAANIRSPELAKRIKEEPADATQYAVAPGELDPRKVFEELERVMPKDYDVVSRLRPSLLLPHGDARRRADEVSRHARFRRDRQLDLLCDRRRRGPQERHASCCSRATAAC